MIQSNILSASRKGISLDGGVTTGDHIYYTYEGNHLTKAALARDVTHVPMEPWIELCDDAEFDMPTFSPVAVTPWAVSGSGEQGINLTMRMASDTGSTVVTSMHKVENSYRFDGSTNRINLPYNPNDAERTTDGCLFKIRYHGFGVNNITNLTVDRKGRISYFPAFNFVPKLTFSINPLFFK